MQVAVDSDGDGLGMDFSEVVMGWRPAGVEQVYELGWS